MDEFMECYRGSDGDRTIALFKRLEQGGPAGVVAINLFRALKASERAKTKYRGKWVRIAYEKKNWAISNLAEVLGQHAAGLQITWGWGHDPKAIGYEWVLYVDLPGAGQISFHTAQRLPGPDHPTGWDRAIRQGPERLARWAGGLLDGAAVS